jgi:phage baseplate assembly protein W
MNKHDIDYPFTIDGSGFVSTTGEDDHIRDMIHQVLFTNPGERVNRPDFGCGLLQLVFMPNSDALAAATQYTVQGALQRWLDDVIKVEQVQIVNDEERLEITVVYIKRDTGDRRQQRFVSGGSPG